MRRGCWLYLTTCHKYAAQARARLTPPRIRLAALHELALQNQAAMVTALLLVMMLMMTTLLVISAAVLRGKKPQKL
jgi:hypothetical protein